MLDECQKYGYATELVKLSDITILPCHNCNYECFGEVIGHSKSFCPLNDDAMSLWEKVESADGLLWTVPNYCGAPCASFMSFRERIQGFVKNKQHYNKIFLNKPFIAIIISNTSTDYLTPLVVDSEMPIKLIAILELAAKKYNRVSLHGDLIEEVEIKDTIKKLSKKLTNELTGKD